MSGQDIFWLELTNGCNLTCQHCYTNSSPDTFSKDQLNLDDYRRVISEAKAAGFLHLMLIGGEPTAAKFFADCLKFAFETGFIQISVYSNLYSLSEKNFTAVQKYKPQIFTSLHSSVPKTHDKFVKKNGAFSKTMDNSLRLIKAGVEVSVGITLTDTEESLDSFSNNLLNLGFSHVSCDHIRPFGRGNLQDDKNLDAELCGQCSSGTLCLTSTGKYHPCIMSRHYDLGSAQTASISDILASMKNKRARTKIYNATLNENSSKLTNAKNCSPMECRPKCGPSVIKPKELLSVTSDNSNGAINCSPMECRPKCGPSVLSPKQIPDLMTEHAN